MSKKKSFFLEQLNPKQREAAAQITGPILVLAGAGSGKTRTLTYRIAHLIKDQGVLPVNILAVTFTNKAAGEMRERIQKLLGVKSNSAFSPQLPQIGTFHSICSRILRQEIEKIGYDRNFVIYDDQDQQAAIKKVMKQLEISPDKIKPRAILGAISAAKNQLLDAEKYQEQIGSYFEEIVSKAFWGYQEELRVAKALDFDDLLLKTVKIFQVHLEILNKYQELFQFILVDEYQDTNHAQYTFLQLLTQKHQNICVVGDDWQSIYGWRQADIRNILNFEKDYPQAKVVLLEQNYRSSQNILNAAHGIISKNVNQKKKELWTENPQGELLTIYEAFDEKDEAHFIVEQIQATLKNSSSEEAPGNQTTKRLSDFAILYRTNAQSRALEEAFLQTSVPYKIIGGVKFYQRKEVKDILAYLQLIQNPADRISFERIINVPSRKLGTKTIEKIFASQQEGEDLLATLKKITSSPQENFRLTANQKKSLQGFLGLIQQINEVKDQLSLSQLINQVYQKSGYQTMLLKEGEEGKIRQENIQELLTVAQKYDSQENSLEDFLQEVTLVSQTDRDLEQEEAVPLMTLHSAKGLEYDTIFIVGMEEGLFPHSRATFSDQEMEEERRLCYVGITRAKQKAFLIYTQNRNIYGTTRVSLRSRFLDELDSELVEERQAQSQIDQDFWPEEQIALEEALSEQFPPPSPNNTAKDAFQDGDKVIHAQFGQGIVLSRQGDFLEVVFPQAGVKKLSLQYAPLRKA